jgi:hypothetical protein
MVKNVNWLKFWSLKIIELFGLFMIFYFVNLFAKYINKSSLEQTVATYLMSWVAAFLIIVLIIALLIIIVQGLICLFDLWINKNIEWSTEEVKNEKVKRK